MSPIERNLTAALEEVIADLRFLRDTLTDTELVGFCINSIDVAEHYLTLARRHEWNRRVMHELGVTQ